MEVDLFSSHYHDVVGKYPDLAPRKCIHETVRRIINTMVVNLIENSSNAIKKAAPADIDDVRNHQEPMIAYSQELYDSLLQMKRFLRQQLYAHYQVKRMSRKAKEIVQSLFNVFMDDQHLLPPQYQDRISVRDQDSNDGHKARVIADYIAGMTDRYALREHHRLFGPVEMPS